MSGQRIVIRDYREGDKDHVNRIAVRAFEQYQAIYEDWPGFRARLENMSGIAGTGELIVGEREGVLAGAVAYVGPGKPKADFFEPQWPIMRMLVVAPEARGNGIARALAEECLARARRDGAEVFALHTSPIMEVALPMYLRMGFRRLRTAPLIHGVDYDVYVLSLDAGERRESPDPAVFRLRVED
ncbi:GNAT family N-acetyltransferase [Pseudoduganella sp. GCM10020061]|uniref:GNAT family N-acetyltransferase n=1 Tax=Pseudoduganella sp. GCM10020061 TaxID=3317345 RepID=UPI00363794BD